MTLMQLRLVLRIGAATASEIDVQRLPEVLAVIGGGLAFRTVARQALGDRPAGRLGVRARSRTRDQRARRGRDPLLRDARYPIGRTAVIRSPSVATRSPTASSRDSHV